jgi:hypothetical protein
MKNFEARQREIRERSQNRRIPQARVNPEIESTEGGHEVVRLKKRISELEIQVLSLEKENRELGNKNKSLWSALLNSPIGIASGNKGTISSNTATRADIDYPTHNPVWHSEGTRSRFSHFVPDIQEVGVCRRSNGAPGLVCRTV